MVGNTKYLVSMDRGIDLEYIVDTEYRMDRGIDLEYIVDTEYRIP